MLLDSKSEPFFGVPVQWDGVREACMFRDELKGESYKRWQSITEDVLMKILHITKMKFSFIQLVPGHQIACSLVLNWYYLRRSTRQCLLLRPLTSPLG